MSFTYKYPRPALTVDAMVFNKQADGLFVLLVKRKNEPFAEQWAFPGGFVDMHETVEDAAARELYEETNLKGIQLKQFYTFSAVDRDPRGRTVSVVFFGFADLHHAEVKAGDDAADVAWHPLNQLPKLAFDHQQILQKAMDEMSLLSV
ncbi:MAG: NUDIX hydrolase [Bacteroidales bacterium]